MGPSCEQEMLLYKASLHNTLVVTPSFELKVVPLQREKILDGRNSSE